MTRKKSRPTHRENATVVPSNEGGFYKMFWNSMDTNPGTNGPNSPSQGGSVTPPVIIISDSPEGSPCARDENSFENLVLPVPIKEELHEGAVFSDQHSPTETTPENLRQSHSGISRDCSSHQKCLPDKRREPPCRAEEDFVPSLMVVEDIQVRDQVTTEEHVGIFPDSNFSRVANSVFSQEVSFSNNVIPNQSHDVENSRDTPISNEEISHASPVNEGILSETPGHSCDIPEEQGVSVSELHSKEGIVSGKSNISDELPSNTETPPEMLKESSMAFTSEPQSPPDSQVHCDETPHELPVDDILDPKLSTVCSEENNEEPPVVDRSRTLSLLRSLLNAPEEDLEDLNEAFSELPGLIGQHNDFSDPGIQNEGEAVYFESAHESSLHSNIDVSSMDIDQSTSLPETTPSAVENVTPDVCNKKPAVHQVVVDEDEVFPTFNNFLPKKIKLDTVGILRSVKVLKDSMRSLYKEYLKDDVILRTVSTAEPPVEDGDSSDEVEETQSFPHISVYPKICCVKMERLPDPFVKKSTVTMSDDTFKTWKRQIIRQRNEEKFRRLKVWRRGRTLLWRECELAGMDRATYDEQVAYVKKHKLSENSSSDSDSGDDDSVGDAFSHKCDSSEESYSDLENEDSEGELSTVNALSSPIRNTSENQSSPHIMSETSTDIRLPEDEYVVERSLSTHQSSETKAPSALKITIRKASTSKSEEEKEKPTDEEENFPLPPQPAVHKPRRIATKRTFRRPSDPVRKASVPPKSAATDTKKSKSTPVEDEYDQSLLGTRSYEVENFNLLEKWDIPFEEPTLFRSPRAASRLAQLKNKEAFAPTLKRHAPPKTTASTTSSITTTSMTLADVTTVTVSKAVKDVVEMLCSKTVEAMLFPESKSGGRKKPAATDSPGVKDSTTHIQPIDGPSKSFMENEEISLNLDDSSELSHSETNSTLDASSDFSGSTASLVSEDFLPPKNKSPRKPRRRRPRFGPAWGKKKKVKSKATNEQPVVKEWSEGSEHLVRDTSDTSDTRVHSTEKPAAEKVTQEKGRSIQRGVASPVHSTQVPVVSEGPGQSPCESEDDSAHRIKAPISRSDTNKTLNESTKKVEPSDVIRMGETPLGEPELNKKLQEEGVLPRLTRSKQPTVELDPELLESFGARKRKPRTGVTDDVSQGEDGKKSKQEVTKKTVQKSKVQTIKAVTLAPKKKSSTTDELVSDESNTQVPEVSEGPGEVGLDHENKQGQLNKVETYEPSVRMLRSRSRGPGPCPTGSATSPVKPSTDGNQLDDEPFQVMEDKSADKNLSEELLVLESPASPPPESVEPEPLTNSRITRSKRRLGPAYVAVKSTFASALPSVCDIVDSIAGHRLPTPSKLFDASAAATSGLATEPIAAFRVQSSGVTDTPLIAAKLLTSSPSELAQQPTFAESEHPDGKSIQPPTTIKGTCPGRITVEQATIPMCSDSSSILPVPTLVTGTSVDVVSQTSELSNNCVGVDISSSPIENNQSAAIAEGDVGAGALEEGASSGTASGSSSLTIEKPATENVECGRLEVLDTLNTILAVTSPTKVRHPVRSASPLLPPPLSSKNLQATTPMNVSVSQPSISNNLTPSTENPSSLPTFLTSTQDMNNILPGTFLNSFLNSTLDANLTTYSNDTNDSASLADDPDGDLVIDEGEVPDVNFWENLTNADLDKNDNSADFSDDDNNTDLADKIDKIIKDQIHQDPVPVRSLNSKETIAGSRDEKVLEETSPSKSGSVLNRRDSIDERTGLPNNLIQRLRDPRIRSRLLSQLEEEEANGKTQSPLAPLLNILPVSSVASSTVGDPRANKIGCGDHRKKPDGITVPTVSSSSSTDSLCMGLQVPTVSKVITDPIMGAHLESISPAVPGQPTPLTVPNTPALAEPLVTSGTLGQLPLVAQRIQPVENLENPEEPPDPSNVDFLVPPSDDEEGESIKRRPKKSKKEVDVELMYKSPLEDLQSEARAGYGERAPRRYADNFPRKRSGDDRRSRFDDRWSRTDDPRASRGRSVDRRFEDRGRSQSRDRRFEDRGRSRSRDQRFEDRGRSRSRDQRFEERGRSRSRDVRFDDRERDRSRSRDRRAYYDRPPRDQSRDRRAYDLYTGREDPDNTTHHMEMQVPYNQSPWPASPAFNHHQAMMVRSPRWQPNYFPESNFPPHPPIFVPEPPKIDYMETRLINLELLPKTTNLEISPIRKVYSYFEKDSAQVMDTPAPAYDPDEQPYTIKMMDPVSEEMIDIIQIPRPTSGLTKEIFSHVPPDLNLDDVVKYHFIAPSYVMVRDNEEDPLSSSDEEGVQLEPKQNIPPHHSKLDSKNVQHRKRLSKPLLEHHQKRERKTVDEYPQKQVGEPSPEYHSKRAGESVTGNRLNQENLPKSALEDTPLQNILQSLPLLQQYSSQRFHPPIPTPPPPPEWNDVDLRMSRELPSVEAESTEPDPPKERSRKRSRSRSPRLTSHRSRNSRSPRRRRSRSRSPSRSDMSISPSRSTSRSPSRSYSRRGSGTPRMRRSRSRSSERSRSSRSRRSCSPKRHSTSLSPSRKHRR